MTKQISVGNPGAGRFIHTPDGWQWKDPHIRKLAPITSQRQIARSRAAKIHQPEIDPDPSIAIPLPVTPIAHANASERMQSLFVQDKPRLLMLLNEVRMGYNPDPGFTLDLLEHLAGSRSQDLSALLTLARLKDYDDNTYLHSVAVCILMLALGNKIGLEPARVRRAGMAGLLHDVGKVMIPLAILNKPARLNDQELTIMRRHPLAGAQLLMGANADRDLLEVALYHHEKFDGSGYPYGLKGAAIPLYARMTSICDVYDALTSHRPYRKGWSPARAIRYMLTRPGQFDRQLLHSFMHMPGLYSV